MSNVANIGRQKYVSQSALSAILEEVRQNGIPDASSRSTIKRHRDTKIAEMTNQFGEMLVELEFECVDPKGKPLPNVKLPFIQPVVFLQHCVVHCPSFLKYFKDFLAGHGNSPNGPYELAVYADEVSPGNQLRHDAQRKCQIVYWTIKQGPAMGIDQLWFTLGLARSSVVSAIKGGMSAYMKSAMELFIRPIDLRLGVQLQVEDTVVLKFFRFGMIIADEAALKETFSFKGAAGIQMCPLCTNIVNESSQLHMHSTNLVPSSSTEPSTWKQADSESIRAKIRHLHASFGNCTKAAFEELEKSLGWTHNPHGLLGDGVANPLGIQVAETMQYDWMHTLLVNGCWNVEVGALLQAIRPLGHSQPALHQYLSKLSWPSSISSHAVTGRNIFRKKQEGNVSCSASEGLGVYSPIRAYLMDNMDTLNTAMLQVASYMAVAKVLDDFGGVRRGKCTVADLTNSIHRYVKAHQAAYKTEHWIPKFHYLQHIPKMIQHQGVVAACFVHERKHRVAKRYAENMRNVANDFDRSILKDVLDANLRDLCAQSFDQLHIGLLTPVPANATLAALLRASLQVDGEAFYSKQAHYAFGAVSSVDDFVILQHDGSSALGQIMFHASVVPHVNLVCVTIWDAKGSNQFEKSNVDRFFDLACIQDCVIYQRLSPSRIKAVPNTLWI